MEFERLKPEDPPEPEPESERPWERSLIGIRLCFFSDEELAQMYRECQNFKEDS